MKKFQPPPLKIICAGFSADKVYELADRLRNYFFDVDIYGDTIYANKPRDYAHYALGWLLLDECGVKVI